MGMRHSSRRPPLYLVIALRVLVFTAGLLLLMGSLPHADPWNMKHVNIETGEDLVRIDLSFLDDLPGLSGVRHEFDASLPAVFASLAFLLLTAILLVVYVEPRDVSFRLGRRGVMALAASAGVFMVTLLPTSSGMPIILYLMLSTSGLACVFAGAQSLFPRLWQAGEEVWLVSLGGRLQQYIFGMPEKVFLLVAFLVSLSLTNAGSYFLFEHLPHIHDSIAQLFQGKIFAYGRIYVPSHELSEFYDFEHMINNGRWYSEYPPGHPFFLMIGLLLGIPWMVNPLFGALFVVTVYFLGKELYDEKTGRLAAILALASPFVLFMSSEYMSHGSALFWLALFVLCYAKTVHRRGFRHAAAAGAALGMALNIRPVAALAFSIPFVVYALYLFLRHFRAFALRLAVMGVTALCFLTVLLLYNYGTNGDPLVFGYQAKYGSQFDYSLVAGLVRNLNNMNALNKYLFEWPLPSLIFVFVLFATITTNRWDYLLVCSFVALSAGYLLYPFQDWCFGPRYLYESSAVLILLTARGMCRLPKYLGEVSGGRIRSGTVQAITGVVVLLCFVVGALYNIPPLVRSYADSYWKVNGSVLKAVERKGIRDALVFVRSYYGSVFPQNNPGLDGAVVYARDLREKNIALMKRFPERQYFLANGRVIEEYSSDTAGDVHYEAESLVVHETSGDEVWWQPMGTFGSGWSGDLQVLSLSDNVGDYVTLAVPVGRGGKYGIKANLTRAPDFGEIRLSVNGVALGGALDLYGERIEPTGEVFFGTMTLDEGYNLFRFEAAGRNPASPGFRFGVDYIGIQPDSPGR